MKLKTIAFASGFILVAVVFCPLVLIWLNEYFELPVYDNALLKALSVFFILLEAGFLVESFSLFHIFGKGSPIMTEPTKKFVEKGIYRKIRNPLYIGHISLAMGIFLFFGHLLLLIYPLLSFAIFHLFVVYYEEPELRKKFREDYASYCSRVKRWGLF